MILAKPVPELRGTAAPRDSGVKAAGVATRPCGPRAGPDRLLNGPAPCATGRQPDDCRRAGARHPSSPSSARSPTHRAPARPWSSCCSGSPCSTLRWSAARSRRCWWRCSRPGSAVLRRRGRTISATAGSAPPPPSPSWPRPAAPAPGSDHHRRGDLRDRDVPRPRGQGRRHLGPGLTDAPQPPESTRQSERLQSSNHDRRGGGAGACQAGAGL